MAEQLLVDFNTSGGTISYRGSGILHSMNATVPSAALVTPLKIKCWRGTIGAGESLYSRITASGGKLQVVCSDSYGYANSPDTTTELNSWAATVTSIANTVVAAGHTANYEFDIWNEPDNGSFWSLGWPQFHEAWRRGVLALRAVIPGAIVVGPSYWSYSSSQMSAFLDYCIANNVLPNVLCWHEINGGNPSGPDLIDDHKADAVALIAAKSLSINRFSINEINYVGRYDPGYIVRFLGALERNGIETSARACFGDCDDNSLDGLLTPGQGQRSAWWVQKMYADLTGTLVTTTQTAGLEGVATKDPANNKAMLLLGRYGTISGGMSVRFNNMSAVGFLGSTVHVKIEGLMNSDTAISAGPVLITESDIAVSGGLLDVPVSSTSYSAWLLTLTAGTGGGGGGGGGWTPTWTQLTTVADGAAIGDGSNGNDAGRCQARVWQPACWDTQRNHFVVFGGAPYGGCDAGYLNDLWRFRLSDNSWKQLAPTLRSSQGADNVSIPMGRDNHQVMYDSFQDLYWMYGGTCCAGGIWGTPEIWSYNPDVTYPTNGWISYPVGVPDSAERYNFIFQYIPDQKMILMFAGETGGYLQDTRTWDTVNHVWANKAPANPPGARGQIENAWAYDTVNKKTLIFGGARQPGWPDNAWNDTWWYDLASNTWTNLNPPSPPGARGQHAVAYDSTNHVFVMYGGTHSPYTPSLTEFRKDLWVYDPAANTWTEIPLSGTWPPGMAHHNMQYDPVNQKFIVWGGAQWDGGTKLTPVWTLQLATGPIVLNIITATLPNGTVSSAYSQTITANGGSGAYTFTLSSGTLPAGLSLTTLGVLSGTPTTAAAYSFVVLVTDTLSATDTQSYSVTIAALSTPTITTTTLTNGFAGAAYSQQIAVSGGSAPFTFSVFSGSLPTGITLSTGGLLSGTPTVATTSSFTVLVTDNASQTDTQAYSLVVTALLTSTMPSLQDEKNTYTLWGWTWAPALEPNLPANPGFIVDDPDIHSETEGDDLWTNLMQFQRTGQQGYKDRATAWARYFKDDYMQCTGTTVYTLCYDISSWYFDHCYGEGLIAWSQTYGDSTHLTAAANVMAQIEAWYDVGGHLSDPVSYYGPRGIARHLLISTAMAKATGLARWVTQRDEIINLFINSSDWDNTLGMYWCSEFTTNAKTFGGTYAAGYRVQNSFQIGILCEAFWRAYLETGNATLRARLIQIAGWVNTYGIDATSGYASGWITFNTNTNTAMHGTAPWSPAYTTDLVNSLVIGYKLTGNTALRDQAKHFFNRGTKGAFSTGARLAGDTEVHHFVDTMFDSSTGNLYYANNKGELRYSYLIFENGGSPLLEGEAAYTLSSAVAMFAVGTVTTTGGTPAAASRVVLVRKP